MSREKCGYLTVRGKKFYVYEGVNTIGRDKQAAVIVKDLGVSQQQAVLIVVDDTRHFISDFNSSNGTHINGAKLVPYKLYAIEDGTVLYFSVDVEATYKKISRREPNNSDTTLNTTATQNTQTTDDTIYAAQTQLFNETNFLTNTTQNPNASSSSSKCQTVSGNKTSTEFAIPDDGFDFNTVNTQNLLRTENRNSQSDDIHDLPTQIVSVEDLPTQIVDVHSRPTQIQNVNNRRTLIRNVHNLPTQIVNKNVESLNNVSRGDVHDLPTQVNKNVESLSNNVSRGDLHDFPTQIVENERSNLMGKDSHDSTTLILNNESGADLHDLPTQLILAGGDIHDLPTQVIDFRNCSSTSDSPDEETVDIHELETQLILREPVRKEDVEISSSVDKRALEMLTDLYETNHPQQKKTQNSHNASSTSALVNITKGQCSKNEREILQSEIAGDKSEQRRDISKQSQENSEERKENSEQRRAHLNNDNVMNFARNGDSKLGDFEHRKSVVDNVNMGAGPSGHSQNTSSIVDKNDDDTESYDNDTTESIIKNVDADECTSGDSEDFLANCSVTQMLEVGAVANEDSDRLSQLQMHKLKRRVSNKIGSDEDEDNFDSDPQSQLPVHLLRKRTSGRRLNSDDLKDGRRSSPNGPCLRKNEVVSDSDTDVEEMKEEKRDSGKKKKAGSDSDADVEEKSEEKHLGMKKTKSDSDTEVECDDSGSGLKCSSKEKSTASVKSSTVAETDSNTDVECEGGSGLTSLNKNNGSKRADSNPDSGSDTDVETSVIYRNENGKSCLDLKILNTNTKTKTNSGDKATNGRFDIYGVNNSSNTTKTVGRNLNATDDFIEDSDTDVEDNPNRNQSSILSTTDVEDSFVKRRSILVDVSSEFIPATQDMMMAHGDSSLVTKRDLSTIADATENSCSDSFRLGLTQLEEEEKPEEGIYVVKALEEGDNSSTDSFDFGGGTNANNCEKTAEDDNCDFSRTNANNLEKTAFDFAGTNKNNLEKIAAEEDDFDFGVPTQKLESRSVCGPLLSANESQVDEDVFKMPPLLKSVAKNSSRVVSVYDLNDTELFVASTQVIDRSRCADDDDDLFVTATQKVADSSTGSKILNDSDIFYLATQKIDTNPNRNRDKNRSGTTNRKSDNFTQPLDDSDIFIAATQKLNETGESLNDSREKSDSFINDSEIFVLPTQKLDSKTKRKQPEKLDRRGLDDSEMLFSAATQKLDCTARLSEDSLFSVATQKVGETARNLNTQDTVTVVDSNSFNFEKECLNRSDRSENRKRVSFGKVQEIEATKPSGSTAERNEEANSGSEDNCSNANDNNVGNNSGAESQLEVMFDTENVYLAKAAPEEKSRPDNPLGKTFDDITTQDVLNVLDTPLDKDEPKPEETQVKRNDRRTRENCGNLQIENRRNQHENNDSKNDDKQTTAKNCDNLQSNNVDDRRHQRETRDMKKRGIKINQKNNDEQMELRNCDNTVDEKCNDNLQCCDKETKQKNQVENVSIKTPLRRSTRRNSKVDNDEEKKLSSNERAENGKLNELQTVNENDGESRRTRKQNDNRATVEEPTANVKPRRERKPSTGQMEEVHVVVEGSAAREKSRKGRPTEENTGENSTKINGLEIISESDDSAGRTRKQENLISDDSKEEALVRTETKLRKQKEDANSDGSTEEVKRTGTKSRKQQEDAISVGSREEVKRTGTKSIIEVSKPALDFKRTSKLSTIKVDVADDEREDDTNFDDFNCEEIATPSNLSSSKDTKSNENGSFLSSSSMERTGINKNVPASSSTSMEGRMSDKMRKDSSYLSVVNHSSSSSIINDSSSSSVSTMETQNKDSSLSTTVVQEDNSRRRTTRVRKTKFESLEEENMTVKKRGTQKAESAAAKMRCVNKKVAVNTNNNEAEGSEANKTVPKTEAAPKTEATVKRRGVNKKSAINTNNNDTEAKEAPPRRNRKRKSSTSDEECAITVSVPRNQRRMVICDEVLNEAALNATAANASVLSPTAKKAKRKITTKVVFTMLDSPQLQKLVRTLGGSIADSVETSTVLVTKSVLRTLKLLSAIGQGKPICSPEWLHECNKANTFLDPWDYLLEDQEAEQKWNFSLRESLNRSKSKKLLEGYTFLLLSTYAPETLKGAIESCGGRCLMKAPKGVDFIVVAAVENRAKCAKHLNQNVKVVLPEAILDGVLRQEIHFDKHLLT